MNTLAVIIPTYNAFSEIVETIKGIKKIVPHATIVIVDDSSPDGTYTLVKDTFAKDKKVKPIKRLKKEGRGSAVLFGFKEALKNKHLKHFIEMDADLCHNPKYILQMVSLNKKVNIVIASKYHKQSTMSGLSFKRLFMSTLMNKSARIILQVPISDYTNGFRCYNRDVVEFLTKQKFTSHGFVVLSEIAYLCKKQGFSFMEIPFDFKQVSKGASNLTVYEIKEAIVTLIRLRLSK